MTITVWLKIKCLVFHLVDAFTPGVDGLIEEPYVSTQKTYALLRDAKFTYILLGVVFSYFNLGRQYHVNSHKSNPKFVSASYVAERKPPRERIRTSVSVAVNG
jgi:hypothetical protein